jgi:hypothetical protein
MAKYTSGRQKNLKVGLSSYSENLTSLEVIGKVGIGTTNTTSSLYVVGDGYFVGVVSASNFYVGGNVVGQGNVSGTTIAGVALSISGISTLGTVQISSGIVTATSGVVTYYGDGSKLSGVTATATLNIQTSSSVNPQYLTYVGTATTTVLGISTANLYNLTFLPSSGYLGIGITTPLYAADVANGDIRVQSTNKMRFGGTSSPTNFYIQYNSTTNSLDFVAG